MKIGLVREVNYKKTSTVKSYQIRALSKMKINNQAVSGGMRSPSLN
jgi:hypothetical protein